MVTAPGAENRKVIKMLLPARLCGLRSPASETRTPQVGFFPSGGASAFILATLSLFLCACLSSSSLSEADRLKLDPPLVRLLNAERVVDADYDFGLRPDGTREYAVIVRSNNVEDLRSAGIRSASVFGDVITARVTIAELRKILRLNSVRAVSIGSKNYHQ